MTLVDTQCLWQDLDGLHVEGAPVDAPHTSFLWAWDTTGHRLLRVRLDRDETGVMCFVAQWDGSAAHVEALRPYAPNDQRTLQARHTGATLHALELEVITEEISEDLAPGLAFLRPRAGAGA